MELKDYTEIVCPECKALLFAEERLDFWYCGHCGHKIAVPHEKVTAKKIENPAPVLTGDEFVCDRDTLVKYNGVDEEVDIPDYVTKIGQGAFKGNTKIKSVSLHNEITEMADSVFEGCSMLSEVTLSPRLKKIGFKTFNDCDRLRTIRIPASVEQIMYNAMCCGLEEIIFDSSYTTWEPENEYTSPSFEVSRNGTAPGVKKIQFKGTTYNAADVYRHKSIAAYLRSQGLCPNCGGKFGLFNKCKTCGEKKEQ